MSSLTQGNEPYPLEGTGTGSVRARWQTEQFPVLPAVQTQCSRPSVQTSVTIQTELPGALKW